MVLSKILRFVLVLTAITLVGSALSGCGAEKIPKKVWEVIKDPNIEVGEPKDLPTIIDLTIFLEPDANKNDFDEDVPADVWFFQLGDDGRFLQSDFYEISSNPEEALATTFVDVKEFQIKPGASKIIRDIEINKDTNYIGIVGGYLRNESINWRSVMKINPKGEKYKVLAVLNRKKVIINIHR